MTNLLSCARAGLALLAGGTLLLPSAGSAQPAAPLAQARPNILLIVADDLGYGDLGCYGQKQIRTPNLDQLAAAGTRFTSFYAGSAVCAPSRCALMTGRHTGHGTIRGNLPAAALTPQDATLPLLLQGTYATGLVGKWGLGNEGSTGLPGDKGIDVFIGYLDQARAHDYYAPYVDRYDAAEGLRRIEYPSNANGGKGTYFPDLLQKAALNFIRIQRPTRYRPERLFFLVYTPTLPHANNELGRKTGNGLEVPNDKPYTDQPWPQAEKNKAAMITRLDNQVGEILARLKQYHQESNTLILFTSDNGPHSEGGVKADFLHSAGSLRGIKRDLYEGGIRVPLLAVWPGKIPAGRVSDEPWAFWDLLPTLAEVAGKKAPADLDGLSYLPTLLGGAQTNRHEYFYWEFHEGGFKQAVRAGDWKGVKLKGGAPLELYNLASDLGETKNVAGEHADVVARLDQVLKTARTESPAYPISPSK